MKKIRLSFPVGPLITAGVLCWLSSAAVPIPSLLAQSSISNAPPQWPGLNELRAKWAHTSVGDLEKTAGSGDLNAQYYLGCAYRDGIGVTPDLRESLNWLRRAADRGHTGAMVEIGRACRAGNGVERDVSEAMKWFQLAAEHGNLMGTFSIALMHEQENALADQGKAFRMYRQLADQGLREGAYKVALCYRQGIGVEKSPSECLKWLVMAAEADSPEAQCELGWYYEKGIRGTRGGFAISNNMPEAIKWYQRAVDQNSPIGMHLLALCFMAGKGVDWDEERGLELMRESADLGFSLAIIDLANLYASGIGEPRNENDRPLNLLIRAALSNERRASEPLVRRLQDRFSPDYDLVSAAEWYSRAALIRTWGFSIDGKILTASDEQAKKTDPFARALSLYLKAMQRRDADAMFEIGNLYLTGRNVPRAPDQAWAWLKSASDHGSGKAGELLATVEKAMSPEQIKAGRTRAAELADHIRLSSGEGATR